MNIDRVLRAGVLVALLAASPLAAQEAGHQAHHPGAPGAMQATPDAGAPMGEGGMMPPMATGDRTMPMMRECMGMMRSMMQGMAEAGMEASAPDDPVAGAFAAINNRMHRDMAFPVGATPDAAFAQAMIAHHRGAIDMARVVLGFGTDPEIHKLAQDIIAAQGGEIEFLQKWLARQSPP